MENDLNFHIFRLVETAESISSVYFRPPGVFTNAMLTKPDITSLMRDADPSEEALYATSNDPRAVLNRASSELKAAYSKTNSRRKMTQQMWDSFVRPLIQSQRFIRCQGSVKNRTVTGPL